MSVKKSIISCFFLLIPVFLSAQGSGTKSQSTKVFNIKDYGAVGDGVTLNTEAINKTITACAEAGGGTVMVPAGKYLSGTVQLKSNITLYLDNDATIIGTADLQQYKAYHLDLGAENPQQPNIKNDMRWSHGRTLALIMLNHVNNVTITGMGTIDGAAVVDVHGEEGRRGPHGILIGNSQNITISNIRVTSAGNYNIIGIDADDVKLINITIIAGYDGIHVEWGKNLHIEHCKFYTADDAIAGGYWQNVLITDCFINSSCNGIRLIFPATNMEISNCQIWGPGVTGHPRGVGLGTLLSTNSLTGIILQPGAWQLSPGKLDSIYIHDIQIRDMQTALNYVLNEGNQGNQILTERVTATGISGNPCSVEGWPDDSKFDNIKFKDIAISYNVTSPRSINVKTVVKPRTESRALPYWGFYVRNVRNISFENVKLDHTGDEVRPVMGFDSVDNALLKNVKYTEAPGSQIVYDNKKTVLKIKR